MPRSESGTPGTTPPVDPDHQTSPPPTTPSPGPPESGTTDEIWPPEGHSADSSVLEPGTTGRFLVLMRDDAISEGIGALSNIAGVSFSGDAGGFAVTPPEEGGARIFERLGVAVVNAAPDQAGAVAALAANDSAILAVEPERVVYAIGDRWPGSPGLDDAPDSPPQPGFPSSIATEYLVGYRDGVNHLVDGLLSGGQRRPDDQAATVLLDRTERDFTWGLQATNADETRYSGRGIRVAILDTGLDLGHPDFANRVVVGETFVPGQAVDDAHGHGTHCTGTVGGPRNPNRAPRYGVAPDADLYVGKVLSNRGSGVDEQILAGIEWALSHGCAVISMSLGARTYPGQRYNEVFEAAARRALRAGTLIVAAAGNDSYRPQLVRPISHPANCPAILAVGAVDHRLRVATFSNGARSRVGDPPGGQVDISGPGVGVRSSWPRPVDYHSIDGTSMATPHVAGIAALYAEARPGDRGVALAVNMLRGVRRLPAPSEEVGRGLVQAP